MRGVGVRVEVELGGMAVAVEVGTTAVLVLVGTSVAVGPPGVCVGGMAVLVTVLVAVPPPVMNLRPYKLKTWSGSGGPGTQTRRSFHSWHAGLALLLCLNAAALVLSGTVGRRFNHSHLPLPWLAWTDTQKLPDGIIAGGLSGSWNWPVICPVLGMMLVWVNTGAPGRVVVTTELA